MITTPRPPARATAVAATALLGLALMATPAWAADPMPGSADDSVMSTGQAILVFVGIPLVVVAVIWLLVLAPGWTRGGRPSSTDAWTADPLVVGSAEQAAAPALDAAAEPVPDETGGSSASW